MTKSSLPPRAQSMVSHRLSRSWKNYPIDPISPYGASKACAETIARMFYRVYGLPVVIARIFNTYGPRMARFVDSWISCASCSTIRHVLEVLGRRTAKARFHLCG